MPRRKGSPLKGSPKRKETHRDESKSSAHAVPSCSGTGDRSQEELEDHGTSLSVVPSTSRHNLRSHSVGQVQGHAVASCSVTGDRSQEELEGHAVASCSGTGDRSQEELEGFRKPGEYTPKDLDGYVGGIYANKLPGMLFDNIDRATVYYDCPSSTSTHALPSRIWYLSSDEAVGVPTNENCYTVNYVNNRALEEPGYKHWLNVENHTEEMKSVMKYFDVLRKVIHHDIAFPIKWRIDDDHYEEYRETIRGHKDPIFTVLTNSLIPDAFLINMKNSKGKSAMQGFFNAARMVAFPSDDWLDNVYISPCGSEDNTEKFPILRFSSYQDLRRTPSQLSVSDLSELSTPAMGPPKTPKRRKYGKRNMVEESPDESFAPVQNPPVQNPAVQSSPVRSPPGVADSPSGTHDWAKMCQWGINVNSMRGISSSKSTGGTGTREKHTDLYVAVGYKPNWPRFLFVVEVKSSRLTTCNLEQLLLQMAGALVYQSFCYGLLINATEVSVLTMWQDVEKKQIYVDSKPYSFEGEGDSHLGNFDKLFCRIVASMQYGVENIKEIVRDF